uniref:tRNA-aminoacylation cofactor arc1-like n=1 Tax=Cicer arietinum TaxID=3827 RepID=A0A3Q7YAW1_CICAR|nr:tRNA-aminoacylation cofactor arc1-like [Cicer arietinum]
MQGKKVIVLSNLKPRNMHGVKSSGMLMAASDSKHENVELLFPPEEANPGERIWFGSEDEKDNQPAAAAPNQLDRNGLGPTSDEGDLLVNRDEVGPKQWQLHLRGWAVRELFSLTEEH